MPVTPYGDRTTRKVRRGTAPATRGRRLDDELVVAHRRPWPRIREGVGRAGGGGERDDGPE